MNGFPNLTRSPKPTYISFSSTTEFAGSTGNETLGTVFIVYPTGENNCFSYFPRHDFLSLPQRTAFRWQDDLLPLFRRHSFLAFACSHLDLFIQDWRENLFPVVNVDFMRWVLLLFFGTYCEFFPGRIYVIRKCGGMLCKIDQLF